jgi:hypothetical protein
MKKTFPNSAYREFPRDLAEEVRAQYPKLWSKHGTGGNPPTRWTGDDAYRAWGWLLDLKAGKKPPKGDIPDARFAFEKLTGQRWAGPAEDLFETVTDLWVKKREAYITRHAKDFRPGGTIAMIKWAGVFPWAEAKAPGKGHLLMLDALEAPRKNSPCSGEFYHATAFTALESIAERGLVPRAGSGTFGHSVYGQHSQGKVFLAQGRSAALEWFGKVSDMLEYNAGDVEEPDEIIAVLLRVCCVEDEFDLHVDPVGNKDVPCSFYVTQAIPPENIEFYDPSQRDWVSIDEWASADPYDGVSETEFYNEDGDTVDEDEWDEYDGSRGFMTYGPYDRGGFKPSENDEKAWS